MRGMSGKSQIHKALAVLFLEHALHEKGLQRHISGGTLVSSKERNALFVLLLNNWSSAGHTLISFFCWFEVRIRLFVIPKKNSQECSRLAGQQKRGLSPCPIDLRASRPIQPRGASLLRRALP